MNRKIKKTREYRDDYDGPKEQAKKYVCRASRTGREHLKKKNRLDERRCANKSYQRRSDEKMTFAKRR